MFDQGPTFIHASELATLASCFPTLKATSAELESAEPTLCLAKSIAITAKQDYEREVAITTGTSYKQANRHMTHLESRMHEAAAQLQLDQSNYEKCQKMLEFLQRIDDAAASPLDLAVAQYELATSALRHYIDRRRILVLPIDEAMKAAPLRSYTGLDVLIGHEYKIVHRNYTNTGLTSCARVAAVGSTCEFCDDSTPLCIYVGATVREWIDRYDAGSCSGSGSGGAED